MFLDSVLVVIQNIQLLRNFRKSERLLRIQKNTFCGSDFGTLEALAIEKPLHGPLGRLRHGIGAPQQSLLFIATFA